VMRAGGQGSASGRDMPIGGQSPTGSGGAAAAAYDQNALLEARKSLVAEFLEEADGRSLASYYPDQGSARAAEATRAAAENRTITNLPVIPANLDRADGQSSVPDNTAGGETVVRAYRTVYGQLATEATSDTPGPMIVELLEGPLAGARLLGELAVAPKGLGISFRSMEFKGATYPINAIAVDPDTLSPNIATKYRGRILERYGYQLAAVFSGGWLAAKAKSGQTVVLGAAGGATTIQEEPDAGDALAAGGAEVAKQFAEDLRTQSDKVQPLRARPANTGLGVLFLSPVILPRT